MVVGLRMFEDGDMLEGELESYEVSISIPSLSVSNLYGDDISNH